MQNLHNLEDALNYSYTALAPFSERFKVDFKRTLFSLRILERALGTCEGKKILDVGCGIGIMTGALTRLGAHVVGIDKYVFDKHNTLFHFADMDVLKKVWQREGFDIREVDFFRDESGGATNNNGLNGYDVVISEAMIEHLRDPKIFLEQIYKTVQPGGYALISTPNLTTFLQRLRFLFGRSPLWNLKEFYQLGEQFTGHWREYTLDELRQMCMWAGFEIAGAWNKNMLAPFKWNKMPRFAARLISVLVPGSGDMNVVLCKKK